MSKTPTPCTHERTEAVQVRDKLLTSPAHEQHFRKCLDCGALITGSDEAQTSLAHDEGGGCLHLRREPYIDGPRDEQPDDPQRARWFRCLDCGTVYQEPLEDL